MTRRRLLCEGPDDLNALRAIAQHVYRAKTSALAGRQGGGGGAERATTLEIAGAVIEIVVPSKGRGGPGDGKSALPRMLAEVLRDLPPQTDPEDASRVALVGVVFDPDREPVAAFHAELEQAVREHAPDWTLTSGVTPGLWAAQRGSGERVEVHAVDWRAPGGVLDDLPDETNLERLLCAVLAEAYPDQLPSVDRWLTEIGQAQAQAGLKKATWKAAIHVWLALIYDKGDELNAASRVLHQQDRCKPHVAPILDQLGLLRDLRPLLGPG